MKNDQYRVIILHYFFLLQIVIIKYENATYIWHRGRFMKPDFKPNNIEVKPFQIFLSVMWT